jgi:hypothetical protein
MEAETWSEEDEQNVREEYRKERQLCREQGIKLDPYWDDFFNDLYGLND